MPKKKAKKKAKKSKRLPPLSFDSTGSAEAIFIGSPVEIDMHWADCALKQHELVCPQRIGLDGRKCGFCESNQPEGYDDFLEIIFDDENPPPPNLEPRGLSLCWDVVKRRWSFLMTSRDFFRKIMRNMAGGGNIEPFKAGKGPRYIIQRIGRSLVALKTDKWDDLANFDAPPAPPMDDLLVYLEKKSVWVKYDTVDEVVAAHPKPGTPGIYQARRPEPPAVIEGDTEVKNPPQTRWNSID